MLSIISKEFRFADLDKNCAKQRAQLCRSLNLAPSHTAQLSSCFKLARTVKDLKLVQKTVRNCPVARNRRENNLRNCRFACVKNVKKRTTRQNIFKILPKASEEKGCATLNLP